jgi:hypothetical protein
MAVSRPLLGPRRSVYIALIGIVIYTLLVGAGASVVRAAIMSGLALIGQRLGRRAWRLNTLAAATDEEYTIRLGRACVRLIEAIDVGIEKERGQEDRTVLKGARLPIWPTQISTARCPSRLIESVAIGIFMSLVALWLTV